MDQSEVQGPKPDHVGAALDASCGALIAMQVARLEMADSEAAGEAAMREIERAMAALRRAIDLLRVAPPKDAEILSVGFVLGAR
jgi:hypothetical protein